MIAVRSARALSGAQSTAAAAAAATAGLARSASATAVTKGALAMAQKPSAPHKNGSVLPQRRHEHTASHGQGATAPPPTQIPSMAPPAFNLSGRLVLLTGGAQGLGLVMGQAIVASGADLALVDLKKEDAELQAKIMVEAYRKRYPDRRPPLVTAHYANVADETSVAACVNEVVAIHTELRAARGDAIPEATINGLVTSAGFTENIPAVDYPPARLRALWSVNVDGTYLFATAVARHLATRDPAVAAKASMVLIGSMSGAIVNIPQPQAPYNASKAAIRHLASSLAVEWAPQGIRVNCLSPGYMQTALTKKILDDKPALRSQWTNGVPQGRLGQPEDLTGPVVFLLSDAAAYVTGAELRVDGGYTVV